MTVGPNQLSVNLCNPREWGWLRAGPVPETHALFYFKTFNTSLYIKRKKERFEEGTVSASNSEENGTESHKIRRKGMQAYL